MAKSFKIFVHGIKLQPTDSALACCSDPAPCFSADDHGTLYVRNNKLRVFLECGMPSELLDEVEVVAEARIEHDVRCDLGDKEALAGRLVGAEGIERQYGRIG